MTTIPILSLDVVDSTNTEAMRRIAAGERGPLWICAARQTGGKGRDGRRWVSEVGNFYGSLLLPLTVPRTVVSQLSLIAGVAVIDALVEVAGKRPPGLRLKWPNDVLIGGGKLAGILPESTVAGADLVAVIGIGINLVPPPVDVGRSVAALTDAGLRLEPATLVAPLGHWLMHWIGLWSAGNNFRAVKEAWLDRAGTPGEAISVNTGAGLVGGTYHGLDDDGALLMRQADGQLRRVTFGDVMVAAEIDDRSDGRARQTQ